MRPLEGIKVIELAEYVAVPGAPRLLADWGATVYKIERPQGDPSRHLGPSFKMIDFMKEDYINIYLNRKNCKKHKNNIIN